MEGLIHHFYSRGEVTSIQTRWALREVCRAPIRMALNRGLLAVAGEDKPLLRIDRAVGLEIGKRGDAERRKGMSLKIMEGGSI